MKIILQREVEKLGVPGDVVNVAIPASKGAVRHAESLRRAHEDRVAKGRSEAEALAERISGSPIKVRAKAGEGGRLFGSVTAADLADELERQTGEIIDRRMIHLEEPIRSVGVHEVRIHLHPEVNTPISVEIEPA